MVTHLEEVFPSLSTGSYHVTSPANPHYNCIAWASGDTGKWWWPGPDPDQEYWPTGVPRESSVAAFFAVFALAGYSVCDSEEVEEGIEKLALFGNTQGLPTHAARQLSNGRWTSKLGKREDIEHALHDLEGELYGRVVHILKRPTQA
jgi:hypothetical protein